MLKEIVDETSIGKYDFMYLRIGQANHIHGTGDPLLTLSTPDFANNCKYVISIRHLFGVILTKDIFSVGYAFINFEDVSYSQPSGRSPEYFGFC